VLAAAVVQQRPCGDGRVGGCRREKSADVWGYLA
jgi:hypothetical protein